MSGIGIEFRRIYRHRSITSSLRSLGGSLISTLTPMLTIILVLLVMYNTLDYDGALFAERELLSATLMYIFVFSLIVTSLFSAPISRLLGDSLYLGHMDDILPCYYSGLALTMGVTGLLAMTFFGFVYLSGQVALDFAVMSFCAFVSMALVFYNMTFMSAAKDLRQIAIYFAIGMAFSYVCAWVMTLLGIGVIRAMLLGMTCGFWLIAALEYALVRSLYPHNSRKYGKVFAYIKQNRLLMFSNLLYTLGLFVHNFVYWTGDLSVTVAGCFVYAPTYDKASCVAMYTNIMASVLFVMQVQTHFTDRFKEYSGAVHTGRMVDIEVAKSRMFRMMNYIIMSVVKLQFITSVGLFLLFMVVLPGAGFYGLSMDIYPCLAAGYFVTYMMYAQLMFLNYYEDAKGSLYTSLVFFAVTLVGSIAAMLLLPYAWQGLGLFAGGLSAWAVAFFRLKWVQRRYDALVFCRGELISKKNETMPSSRVYSLAEQAKGVSGI